MPGGGGLLEHYFPIPPVESPYDSLYLLLLIIAIGLATVKTLNNMDDASHPTGTPKEHSRLNPMGDVVTCGIATSTTSPFPQRPQDGASARLALIIFLP